jgi:hypothetical protein
VAVEIERDADLAMAQALADDLGVNAAGEKLCGVGVAEIMEADPAQFVRLAEVDKLLSEAIGLQWLPIGASNDVVLDYHQRC